MILLTRLNNKPLVVNSDLIKFIEAAPDTVITLISGEKIIVRESSEEIVARVVDFRRQLGGWLAPAPSSMPTVRGSREEMESTAGTAFVARDSNQESGD